MTSPESSPPVRTTAADWLARALFFTLLVVGMVALPNLPTNDLDASWRMALGRFFSEGLQFGRDVVFTYGPLGFLMGKTYGGQHLFTLVLWQVLQALVFTTLIFRQGLRLQGYPRYVFFAFFFLLGSYYEDATHQIIIAFAGFELLRRSDEPGRVRPALLALLLAVLGLVKFTDCMLGALFILATVALQLWQRRRGAALWTAAFFFGGYLAGWLLCRQNPLYLPDYFYNSWEISQGYQETMGIPTPPEALAVGLTVLGLVITYALVYFFTAVDRVRAGVTVLALGAFTYLNWKHGFVRADGHMIGFYYCMLAVAVSFPALLADGPRLRLFQRGILVTMFGFSLVGIGIALPGVLRGMLGGVQERLFTNCERTLPPSHLRAYYDQALQIQTNTYELPRIRAIVGQASVDVLGYEQAVALFNHLNYHPRPVFQSYSAYRPYLTRLNAKFYASDRAPDYALVKLHTIDARLVTFDDAEVLHLLSHRYDYVTSEKGFQLWQRKPGPFDRKSIAPTPLKSITLPVGEAWNVEAFSDRPLWVAVDVQPSFLGRLLGFFYKLPIIKLRIQDTKGGVSRYRMPLPQGRTGFIINPIVEDMLGFMRFAGGSPERLLRSLCVEIPQEDWGFFAPTVTYRLSSLPPSDAGKKYFAAQEKLRFHMFKCLPLSYEAQTTLSEGTIDNQPVMVFHAPSQLIFDVPSNAHEFTGAFGYLEGAYTGENRTDGAVFYVTWRHNGEETILFERSLDPLRKLTDRGLQSFRVKLPGQGGQLCLRVHPGAAGSYAWDWTAWTGLDFQ